MLSVAAVASMAAQRKNVEASSAWVQLPAAAAKQAVAFAVVNNPTMYDVYVVGAESDVAGKIELRDVRKGPTAVKELTAPAFDALYMDPKGAQMVLLDLKRALKEGETIVITATTDAGSKLQMSAVVRK